MGRRSRNDRSDRRKECQRTLLAQEAARLICDHGINDFRAAKSKAAWMLGLSEHGALPSNREIEAAVAERNRIFAADAQPAFLDRLRQLAMDVMVDLSPFNPCLVGSVLSGNVTAYSNINLHVFADSCESIGMRLDAIGIDWQLRHRRMAIRRGHTEEFAGYDFMADDVIVEATVFPERRKGHAPLCKVDGRPMRRARYRDVEMLVSNSPGSGLALNA